MDARRVVALTLVLLSVAAPAAASDDGEPVTGLAEVANLVEAVAVSQSRPLDDVPDAARRDRVEARLRIIDATLIGARGAARHLLGDLAGHPALVRLGDEPAAASVPTPGVGLLVDSAGEVPAVQSLLAEWRRLGDALVDLRAVRHRLRATIGLPVAVDDLGRMCPVAGPARFADTWGEPRSWWRDHKGVDMIAESGTPLVAVERGLVLQSGWHWAGGTGVYVRGEVTGDVFYYAHLSDVAPGIEAGALVEAGTLVGWVGATGNASVPHLHLGWMPGTGTVDLTRLDNPYDLMASLCGMPVTAGGRQPGGRQPAGAAR